MQMELTRDTARARAFFEDKVAFSTGPVEVESMMKENADIVLVDVRAAEDYARGHIPGAINLPKGTWENPLGLDKNKVNIVYCYNQNCHLAAKACVVLAGKGFPVMELDGGFKTWEEGDFEVDEGEPATRFSRTE